MSNEYIQTTNQDLFLKLALTSASFFFSLNTESFLSFYDKPTWKYKKKSRMFSYQQMAEYGN